MNTGHIVFLRLPPYYGLRRHHPQNVMAPLEAGNALTMLDRMGYKVTIIDGWAGWLEPATLSHDLIQLAPDVVAIETTTTTARQACQLADTISTATSCVTVACGQHATAMPETLLSEHGFTMCVQGELEETLPELMAALEGGKSLSTVQGLCWREGNQICHSKPRELITDLDRLPFIDYNLLRKGNYFMSSCTVNRWRPIRWGFILSSRGCPYHCIYCSPTLRLSYGARYRAHSPDYVVENIEYLVKAHGMNAIMMPDDVFSLDRNRTAQICALLRRKQLDVQWFCQTRADCVDLELLMEMKASGCGGVCMGVESGSDRILAYLKKDITREQIRTAVNAVHQAQIPPTLFFMVGNPTETYEDYKQTLSFAIELKPLIIQVAYFTPYPGSAFHEQLTRDHGSSLDAGFEHYSHYNDCQFNYTAMDDSTYRRLQVEFYRRFYLRFGYVNYYLRRRFPYSMFNARHEFGLAREAISFIFGRRP